MQKHISFKSWTKLYLLNFEKREKQKQEKGDAEVSDCEPEKEIEGKKEDKKDNGLVEYVYETEEDLSCDEALGDSIQKGEGEKSSSSNQSGEFLSDDSVRFKFLMCQNDEELEEEDDEEEAEEEAKDEIGKGDLKIEE